MPRLWVTPRGKLRSSRLNNAGRSPFPTLTALLMPTACKSAPFGIEVTRVRSQSSRQPVLDVKLIHRIAELELELLSIVHDHYGHDPPTVTPMYVPNVGIGGSTRVFEACKSASEPIRHCEGPGYYVRKLMSRFQADRLSSQADTVEQGNRHRDTSTIKCRILKA